MGISVVKRCTGGSYSSSATPSTPPLAPNPNPYRFTPITLEVIGGCTLIIVRYTDCTTYEGEKVLVYDEVISELPTRLDPHFSEVDLSPIARFKPTDRGIELALMLIDLINEEK